MISNKLIAYDQNLLKFFWLWKCQKKNICHCSPLINFFKRKKNWQKFQFKLLKKKTKFAFISRKTLFLDQTTNEFWDNVFVKFLLSRSFHLFGFDFIPFSSESSSNRLNMNKYHVLLAEVTIFCFYFGYNSGFQAGLHGTLKFRQYRPETPQ